MKLRLVALTLLLLSGCSSYRTNPPVCGDHGELLKTTKQVARSVNLRERPSSSSLYLISDRYVIFMEPASVIDLLRKRVEAFGVRADEQLLAAIEADLPISKNTDLLSYSFANEDLFDRPQYVAAALLESGAASVIDVLQMDTGALRSITAMTLEGMGEWRDFCAPSGESILFVTDVIVD